MSIGTKRMEFICATCKHSTMFPVPDRPAMRETPMTSYHDDPMTIPVCARCELVLGAPPALYPQPFTSDGRMSAMAVEIKARWSQWLAAGHPPEFMPFRVQRVMPERPL